MTGGWDVISTDTTMLRGQWRCGSIAGRQRACWRRCRFGPGITYRNRVRVAKESNRALSGF